MLRPLSLGNVNVVQNDAGNATTSVTVTKGSWQFAQHVNPQR